MVTEFDVMFSDFTVEAKLVMQYAVSIWKNLLSREVPINVSARFQTFSKPFQLSPGIYHFSVTTNDFVLLHHTMIKKVKLPVKKNLKKLCFSVKFQTFIDFLVFMFELRLYAMRILFFLLLIVVVAAHTNAQNFWPKNQIKIEPPVCYASGQVEKSFVPPPPEFLNRLKSGTEQKSDIIVNYSLFPDTAKQAFEYAVQIWETIIESPVPIHIQANWRSKSRNVLGSCGPDDYKLVEGALYENRYYPISAAEKMLKTEINGEGVPDMTAEFNKDINWYFGLDGNTPDSLYDFVTVVLHEIGHGLGITGFFFESGGTAAYGLIDLGEATAFDHLVIKNNGDQLVDPLLFENPSNDLFSALTSNNLFANSPVAIADAGPFKPKLYAPSEWNGGSSIYHLNDASYPHGNENSLMTHAIGKGEAVHDPGPITTSIMADIGWKHMYVDFTPVKDIETLKPLMFDVSLESDFPVDTSKVYVVYSTDSFENQSDTLFLKPGTIPGKFQAELVPAGSASEVQYYLIAGDVKNRVFKRPGLAPEQFYTITIGPDNEKPEITHEAIPYFLVTEEKLEVVANINDNLGIDTAYVEYKINGEIQPTFGLNPTEKTMYKGNFNFDFNQLMDGDEITYNIVAIDASQKGNRLKIPFKNVHRFKIEKIFDPIRGFYTSFDYPASDFVISDFEIYTETGFENGALHSPHPYPSPEENNTYWNFTTILKHPIILQENATMSFEEVVLVEPSESVISKFGDADFWDYVIIEGSKDYGKTWLPLIDGYDSRENIIWRGNYELEIVDQSSTATGVKEWFINRDINLLENENFAAGDTILIQFRLHSDPFANGWGWAIDDLRIQQPVSAPLPVLSPGNVMVYPNPFTDRLTISVQANELIQKMEFEIYNSFGQKIQSIQKNNIVGTVSEQIELTGKSPGMYFVSVKENGNKVFSTKIIKQ